MEDGIPRELQYCHKTYCKKGGHCEKQACIIWGCNFWTGRLAYDTFLTFKDYQ